MRPQRPTLGTRRLAVVLTATILALAGGPELAAQEPKNLPDFYFTGIPFGITALVFSLDGRHLATGLMGDLGPGPLSNPLDVIRTDRPGKVQVWDMLARQSRWVLIRRFEGHTKQVVPVGFSPDGQRLASGGNDATIRLWDVRTGRTVRVLEARHDMASDPIMDLAYSPDGRVLAAAFANVARLWDPETGRILRDLDAHGTLVTSLAVSPDGPSSRRARLTSM